MTIPLIPEQRHERVLQVLGEEGLVSIRGLAELLGVSHMTVRRDIAALQEDGKVVAVRGGVRLAPGAPRTPTHETPLDRPGRTMLENDRKRAIARAAVTLIRPGMVLYLDAGTTVQCVVPHLSGRNDLTVVTNDFVTVGALYRSAPGLRLIHAGGSVDGDAGCTEGLFAAELVGKLNVDLYLVSTVGWSVHRGATTPSEAKAELRRAVLDAAAHSVLLADSTKYGTSSLVRVCPLNRLDGIITDEGLPSAAAERIRELDLDLTLAPVE